MEAQVIWKSLQELASREQLWSASPYVVDFCRYAPHTSFSEEELEALEEQEHNDVYSHIYKLKTQDSATQNYFAQALKDKIAACKLKDVRAYDYFSDGKDSVMYFPLEYHNEDFNDVITRLNDQDYEVCGDIEKICATSFFLIEHSLHIDGKDMTCIAGRKAFRRRMSKHVACSDYETVGVYFEDGVFKRAQSSYFDFDEDIDFIIIDNKVFVFNKFYFEQSTKFTHALYEQTDKVWDTLASSLFIEGDELILDMVVQDGKKIRRKLAQLHKKGEHFYLQPTFMEKFKESSEMHEWGYSFVRDQDNKLKLEFPYTDEEKLFNLMTIIDDGRLLSELTGLIYDTRDRKVVKNSVYESHLSTR